MHIPYSKVNPHQLKRWAEPFHKFCVDYFDEEPTFALVNPDFCSIPDHWHMIACDWFGTPEELQQLHYTTHNAFRTKVKWSPKR
jgi:hypothetical protein